MTQRALDKYVGRTSGQNDNVLAEFFKPSQCQLGQGQSAETPSLAAQVLGLPELVDRIASFMSGNDASCTLRLINKATANHLRHQTKVCLSLPVPHHAFAHQWGRQDATRDLPFPQRQRLLSLTAGTGVIPNLQLAADVAGCTLRVPTLEAAAGGGHLVACQWLRQQGCHWGWQVLAAAARSGDLDTVRWLRDEGCPSDPRVFDAAAAAGHRHVVEWLLAEGFGWSYWAIVGAARGGHRDLLEWLLERLLPSGFSVSLRVLCLEGVAAGCAAPWLEALHTVWLTAQSGQRISLDASQQLRLLRAAAASPTRDWRDKVSWLLQRLEDVPARATYSLKAVAALPDALERIRWLSQGGRRGALDLDLAAAAATAGKADALAYLLDHGVSIKTLPQLIACDAAEAGRLDVLSLLRSRGGVRLGGKEALLRAAKGGQLETLAWLAEAQGLVPELPAASVLLMGAAESGAAAMLTWLRERGCDWRRRSGGGGGGKKGGKGGGGGRGSAAAGEQWPNLSPLLDTLPADDGEPYLLAVENGDLATLRVLRRMGCPLGAPGYVFSRAVEFAPPPALPLLRCLLAEVGCVALWGAAAAAARRRREGREEVLAWVREQEQEQRRRAPEVD